MKSLLLCLLLNLWQVMEHALRNKMLEMYKGIDAFIRRANG